MGEWFDAGMPTWHGVIDAIGAFVLTRPSDTTPLAAVLLVPVAALAFYAARHLWRRRRFRARRVLAAILSRRYLTHRSHVLDVLLMAGNVGLFAMIIGQATLSLTAVSAGTYAALAGVFGPTLPATVDPVAIGVAWSVALFVSYEFAYWLDHYLSHKLPVLWEFHKVHHTASVLSPLTNFRVHPVDSLVFMNIIVACNGVTAGVLQFAFGAGPVRLEFLNHATLITLAITVFAQLQHTHIWIAFTGFWGRVVLSPAHHQLHHSVDVQHHDRNFGNLLAVFDLAFGTLLIPTKARQKLVFGVDRDAVLAHDLDEGLVQPFIAAARHVLPASGAASATGATGAFTKTTAFD